MSDGHFHDIILIVKDLGAPEEGMNRLKKLIKYVLGFADRIAKDHVGAYAAQSSYFILLSFIPILLLIMTSIRYTPLTEPIVTDALMQIVPEEFRVFVQSIIREVYTKSEAVVPISAVLTLWSAGKGILGLNYGVNVIYRVEETRNYLLSRLRATIYMLLFLIMIVVTLVLMVFGNSIQGFLTEHLPVIARMTESILNMRTVISLLTMTLVFLMIYKFLPNRKASFRSQLPGAVISAIAWSGFSLGFSFYMDHFNSFDDMYGSLTMVVLIMLWMYFCMYIILIGAEVNAYFEDKFRQLQQTAMEHLRADALLETFRKDSKDNSDEEKESTEKKENST